MKSYIIAFLIAMAVSSMLFPLMFTAQPHPMPVSIPGTENRVYPTDHEDGMLPEIQLTEQSRPAGIITEVKNGLGCRENIIFPYNANN